MEQLNEILKTLANSALYAGAIAGVIGAVCGLYMLFRSLRRTKDGKATKLDALFLASSSPGFSRFSILNSPDTIGIGVYAALALEQIGAISDIKPQVDVNLRIYPEWPATYQSAARYSALIGDKQKAVDYLSVAKTLANGQQPNIEFPQLQASVLEQLIAQETVPAPSTTSLDTLFAEFRKKPHQLILARSVTALLAGLALLGGGVVLHMARAFIK